MSAWVVMAIGVCGALAVFFAWMLFQVVSQQGRLLLAQEELRSRLARAEATIERLSHALSSVDAEPGGLAMGAQAPEFRLRDLSGRIRSLADYQGKPAVLLFFDPGCGFCAQLAPQLRDLPHSAPRLIVMSRGDEATSRKVEFENDWRCDVLLEPGWDVAATYGVHATPTGYLIDAEGRIASELAIGIEGVLALLNAKHDGKEALQLRQAAAVRKAQASGLGITESRIRRDGLPAGSPAPDFTLPDLERKPRSLADMRGKPVLLVFSDPACGPCQAVAPELERLHRMNGSGKVQVLVVSKGDVETNLQKVNELHLTFPIVLQDNWEISRRYGIFATPVAYLIDEHGVIARDVAVGGEAILSLTR